MTESGRRARGDDGAAILEFTLVAVLLLTLVFGIIQFGLLLSFKQDVTRAAAEGARAGAVAVGVPPQTVREAAQERALSAVNEAVREFGGRFETDGCNAVSTVCVVEVSGLPPVYLGDGSLPAYATAPSTGDMCEDQPTLDCVVVTIQYDRESDPNPMYGEVPIIAALLPDSVRAQSVARINSEPNP